MHKMHKMLTQINKNWNAAIVFWVSYFLLYSLFYEYNGGMMKELVRNPSETDPIKSKISSKTSSGKKDKKTPSKTPAATAR